MVFRDPNNGKPKMRVNELEEVLKAYEKAVGMAESSSDGNGGGITGRGDASQGGSRGASHGGSRDASHGGGSKDASHSGNRDTSHGATRDASPSGTRDVSYGVTRDASHGGSSDASHGASDANASLYSDGNGIHKNIMESRIKPVILKLLEVFLVVRQTIKNANIARIIAIHVLTPR